MARLHIEQRRGDQAECTHPVAAVLCRSDGSEVARIGPPTVTTWRSGAKPLQLEGSLSLLGAEVVASLEDADLAVGAASHSGEPAHVERVRGLLARLGGVEADLLCGAHWPVHEPSARELVRGGLEPAPIHNNCSGKHTFMVAALRAGGHAPDYRDPDHPVQRRIRDVVVARTGGVQGWVVDGCGVPCFVAELAAMARAFACLAAATQGRDGLLGRIGAAMLAHPELVSGTGRHDLEVVRGATEPVISKVGAEGLACMAFPARGLGLVLKVQSGAEAARGPAVRAVLDAWLPGVLGAGALEESQTLRNVVGRVVGRRVAVWSDLAE